MANASLKWNNHITGILQQIEDQGAAADQMDNEEGILDNDAVDEAAAEDEEEAQ